MVVNRPLHDALHDNPLVDVAFGRQALAAEAS